MLNKTYQIPICYFVSGYMFDSNLFAISNPNPGIYGSKSTLS